MNASTRPVLVSSCICMRLPFAHLLLLAREHRWDLVSLMHETGCGERCGLCRPYLRRMLRTGQTAYHDLLDADDG